MVEKKTYNVNKYIGARIKQKRKKLGFSLAQLAELLELSYQQVQKYESGASKISAEKLAHVAFLLNEDIDYFYQDIDFRSIGTTEYLKPTVIRSVRQNKLNVLLIEDEPADAILFQESLCDHNMIGSIEVEHRHSQVIPLLIDKHNSPNSTLPDIIFLDISLPGESGFEILKRIKGNPLLQHIVVVMLSGSINWDDMFKSYKLGAASYILKSNRSNGFGNMITQVANYWANTAILPQM